LPVQLITTLQTEEKLASASESPIVEDLSREK
jgi:hypothetical protein